MKKKKEIPNICFSPGETVKSIDFMIETKNTDLLCFVIKAYELSNEQIDRILNNSESLLVKKEILIKYLMNSNLINEHFDVYKNTKSNVVIFNLLKSPTLKFDSKIKLVKKNFKTIEMEQKLFERYKMYAYTYKSLDSRYILSLYNLERHLPKDIYKYIKDLFTIKDIIE